MFRAEKSPSQNYILENTDFALWINRKIKKKIILNTYNSLDQQDRHPSQ